MISLTVKVVVRISVLKILWKRGPDNKLPLKCRRRNERQNIWRTIFSILWKILHDMQLSENS